MANCEHNINLNNPFRVYIELRYGNTVDGIRLVFFTDDQSTPMDFTGWTFETGFFNIEVELPNVLILSATEEMMNIALGDYNLDIKGTLNSKIRTIVAGRYEVKKDYLPNGCVTGGSTVNLQYFNVIERIVIEGGWLPYFSMPGYNDGKVMQLEGWFGGEGDEPTQYIGWYVGENGYVENIAEATLFGLKGDKGDAFTFDDFTPEQILLLQKPAIDAAEIANAAADNANASADIALNAADYATEVTELAIDTIQDAVTATTNANTAAIAATNAAISANQAAQTAQNARGWTPLYTDEADGERVVSKLYDYVAGTGDKPTDHLGEYLKADGTFTTVKADAANYRGPQGVKGDTPIIKIYTRDQFEQMPVPDANTITFISKEA